METVQVVSATPHIIRVTVEFGEGDVGDRVDYFLGDRCIADGETDGQALQQLLDAGVFERPVTLSLLCRETPSGDVNGTLIAQLQLSANARSVHPFTLGAHHLVRDDRSVPWDFAVEGRHWFEALLGIPAAVG